ncbi:MAG: hypothetical protein SCH98_12500 [Deferrisomatales bacterium]|nr:hypothetical protein [Deferrisomatales bacterium]
MDVETAWENLAQAIAAMGQPGGDVNLKLETVRAGVEVLLGFPAAEVLEQVERSTLGLPTRALVSWLVFEGGRMRGISPEVVRELRETYEATCAPGQEIIPPPAGGGRAGLC